MSRRPTDEPRETLRLAVQSLRLLAGIMLLITLAAMSVRVIAHLLGNRGSWFADAFWAVTYGSPAVAELVFAHFLAERHRWAPIAATAITSVIALLAAIVTYMLLTNAILEGDFILLAAAGLCLVFTTAATMVAYHLPRTLEAIRLLDPPLKLAAFEPILAIPTASPNTDHAAPPVE